MNDRYIKYLIPAILVVLLTNTAVLFAQQGTARLEAELRAGQISQTNYARYRGYLRYAPERLPDQYRYADEKPEKCGTELVNLLRTEMNNFSSQDQAFFRQFLSRPTLPNEYISPGGTFKIHYTTEQSHPYAVSDEDNDSNGIPDFVDEAAAAFDYVHDHYVNVLGYKSPPLDGVDGNEYDIYIVELGDGNYGETLGETEQAGTPWADYSTYIRIDDNFEGSIYYTTGLEALRVTAAHEYHHAVQFAYMWRPADIFFYEMTSTWFEDVMYPEVNDYFQYLPELFGNSINPVKPDTNSFDLSFTNKFGQREYGMSIWNHFIAKRYDPDLIRLVWERMHLAQAIDNIEYVLINNYTTSFADALHEFYVWNYFTGSRANTIDYYSEGNMYPELIPTKGYINPGDTLFTIDNVFLSSKYLSIVRSFPSSYSFDLWAIAEDADLWRATMILTSDNEEPRVQEFQYLDGVTASGTISSVFDNIEVVLIPTVSAKQVRSVPPSTYPLTIDLHFSTPKPIVNNVLHPTIPSPANFGIVDKIKIPFEIKETSEIEINIYNLGGNIVKRFPRNSYFPGLYNNEILWDGRDDNNELVPSGIYI
ncbi:MXAN_6640 family putative metalloprotease, partial [candidate division KSB1 bacterium]